MSITKLTLDEVCDLLEVFEYPNDLKYENVFDINYIVALILSKSCISISRLRVLHVCVIRH